MLEYIFEITFYALMGSIAVFACRWQNRKQALIRSSSWWWWWGLVSSAYRENGNSGHGTSNLQTATATGTSIDAEGKSRVRSSISLEDADDDEDNVAIISNPESSKKMAKNGGETVKTRSCSSLPFITANYRNASTWLSSSSSSSREKYDFATNRTRSSPAIIVDDNAESSTSEIGNRTQIATSRHIDEEDERAKIENASTDYLVLWDYYFSVAYVASLRSKIGETGSGTGSAASRLGACVVHNRSHRIVSIGYTGMPNGCDDDDRNPRIPWAVTPNKKRASTRIRGRHNPIRSRSTFVCHAAMNAIMQHRSATLSIAAYDCLADCSIFVLRFPCAECAKLIVQSGINRVVFMGPEQRQFFPLQEAARLLFRAAKVEMIQYVPDRRKILIDFDRF